MARPLPTLPDLRRAKLVPVQARTVSFFTMIVRAIALGRLPGEQSISRGALLSRMLVALVLSTTLWVYVTNQENPVQTRSYDLQVAVQNLPRGLVLRGGIPTVHVTVSGPQSTLNGIHALAAVAVPQNLTATSSTASNVPLEIQGVPSGLSLTVTPPTLTLQFASPKTRVLPVVFVQLSAPPANLQLVTAQISQQTVSVTGPADLVNQVSQVTVGASLSTVVPTDPNAISFTQTYSLVPQLYDALGRTLSTAALTVKPPSIKVTISFRQSFLIRSLTIAPILIGSPPLGYLLEPPQPQPQTVTVIGPPAAVNGIKSVSTTPIDIQAITHTMTLSTTLDQHSLPPGVTFLAGASSAKHGGPSWKVVVGVSRVQVDRTLPADVTGLDSVAPGLRAQADASFVSVLLHGYFDQIVGVGPLHARLNLSGLQPGVYHLHPAIDLPPTIRSYGTSPATVTVTITGG